MFLLNFITKCVNWLTGSPLVAMVISALIAEFRANGPQVLEFAIATIKDVANKEISPEDKFALTKTLVMAQFPKVADSIINTTIESAYLFYKTSRQNNV